MFTVGFPHHLLPHHLITFITCNFCHYSSVRVAGNHPLFETRADHERQIMPNDAIFLADAKLHGTVKGGERQHFQRRAGH